jgi:hypothetical protein
MRCRLVGGGVADFWLRYDHAECPRSHPVVEGRRKHLDLAIQGDGQAAGPREDFRRLRLPVVELGEPQTKARLQREPEEGKRRDRPGYVEMKPASIELRSRERAEPHVVFVVAD